MSPSEHLTRNVQMSEETKEEFDRAQRRMNERNERYIDHDEAMDLILAAWWHYEAEERVVE